MKTPEDRLVNAAGICVVLLLAVAAAWWFLAPNPVAVTVVSPGTISMSGLMTIYLGTGSTTAFVETTALASGYEVITNVGFNDLIPAEKRSPEFAGAAVYRYATTDTNDQRVLAMPAVGTNCYLYFQCSGDSNFVWSAQGEVQLLVKKIARF